MSGGGELLARLVEAERYGDPAALDREAWPARVPSRPRSPAPRRIQAGHVFDLAGPTRLRELTTALSDYREDRPDAPAHLTA